MNIGQIAKFLKDENEPAFRLKQIMEAYFGLKSDWSKITNLSKDLRAKLVENFPWDELEVSLVQKSADGDTVKFVLETLDGEMIEAVTMHHRDERATVCLSSQIGCPMGCRFCSTGQSGFKRNLTAEELVNQLILVARWIKDNWHTKVSNVVYMGMGEPFLNYDNVKKSLQIFTDKDCFGLGDRRISVSTCGIPEKIIQFGRDFPQMNLAISLHSPRQEVRSQIMPFASKFHVKDVMKAADKYVEMTHRKLFFEYTLLPGINDWPVDVQDLVELMRANHLFHVNLITYHQTPLANYKEPSKKEIDKFANHLRAQHLSVTIRHNFGDDIEGACGQLARKKL